MCIKWKVVNLLLFLSYKHARGDEYEDKCVRVLHPLTSDEADDKRKPCKINPIQCKPLYNISYIQLMPYDLEDFEPIWEMLYYCCNDCPQGIIINIFTDFSEVNKSTIMTSDFVYPVLGPSTSTRLYGYYFVPIYDTPGAVYITTKKKVKPTDLILACIRQWPLVLACLLMALVSGFVSWILETWLNKAEFPRAFISGWYEGFWWSFISMTTVGYGDKTPKSIPGRLFSVLWILTGVISFGLVTASLTQTIAEVNSQATPTMRGRNIGILKSRVYESYLVARHGGIDISFKRSAVDSSSILEMITELRGKTIDGILLDKYTHLMFLNSLSTAKKKDKDFFNNETKDKDFFNSETKDKDFFNSETVLTEISDIGQKLAYGLLIKSSSDYQYFKEYLVDNRIILQSSISSWLLYYNTEKLKTNNSIFSSYGGQTPAIIGVIFGTIFLFGIIYEICRSRLKICQCGFNRTAGETSRKEINIR